MTGGQRRDGTGYPDGLKWDDIPLQARSMAVADMYDALRSVRCYRGAFTRGQSRATIEDGIGTQFNPEMVKAFSSLEPDFDRIGTEMGYAQ